MSQTKAQLIDNLVQPITGALGSASAPTFSFTADPNTGIYSPGADQLAISTNGAGRLFVDSGGAVSIGDTWANNSNPVVYVTKNSDVGNIVLKGNGGTSNALAVYSGGWSGSNQVFGVRGDGSLWGYTNLILGTGSTYSERVRITSAGLVGIGTSSPAVALHVSGSGTQRVRITGTGAANAILSLDAPSTYGNYIEYGVSASTPLRFYDATAAADRMIIDTSGRVGIGTNSVASILHTSGSSDQAVTIQTTTAGADTRINFRNSAGTDAGGIQYMHNGNHLLFNTNAGERARIDGSGRLLVGTSSAVTAAGFGTPNNQFVGDYQKSSILVRNTSNDNTSCGIVFQKIRNTSAVQQNDPLGYLTFNGYDGVTDRAGAYIFAEVDAVPGSGDLPTRLGFSTTADGSSSPTERVRITNAGNVGIGTASPARTLSVYSTSAIPVDIESSGNDNALRLLTVGGSGQICGIQNSSGNLLLNASGSERARIDSSGRLLVGTSSSPSGGQGQYARLVVQGYTGDGTAEGIFAIQRGQSSTSILSQGDIGRIIFNDNVGNTFAGIYCFADATPGTNDHPGRLVFSVTADGAASPTESYRIVNSGRLEFKQNYSARYAQLLDSSSATGTQYFFQFGRNGSECGNITSTGANSTTYATSSDYRLKENLVPMPGAVERLARLKVYRFNFIQEPDRTVDGFIAHEVQAVVPEAIVGEKDAVDDDGNPIYQGIDQSKLVPLLTAALQEAVARIEQLEAAVVTLQGS